MAYDQIVIFKKDRPTKDELREAIVNYFGGYAVGPPLWKDNRWYVKLVGKGSFAWPAHLGKRPTQEVVREERWIEVYCDNFVEEVDVITRQQDEATVNLARGFVRLIARFWDGEIQEE